MAAVFMIHTLLCSLLDVCDDESQSLLIKLSPCLSKKIKKKSFFNFLHILLIFVVNYITVYVCGTCVHECSLKP